jgi:hypothetical protein
MIAAAYHEARQASAASGLCRWSWFSLQALKAPFGD